MTCRRQLIATRTMHANQLKQTRLGGCKAAAKAIELYRAPPPSGSKGLQSVTKGSK